MSELQTFSLERFLSLAGYDLVNYVEPLLAQHGVISESTYDLIRSRLPELDVEHTVYALELCMLLNPTAFIHQLIPFLAHNDSSVCCTAYRLITRLPPSLLTDELVAKIANTPIVDLFDPVIGSGGRIRTGTNKIFIHNLVARFGLKADGATK